MRFAFIAKHRNIRPVHGYTTRLACIGRPSAAERTRSAIARSDKTEGQQVKASFLASDGTYGARRVWRKLPADCVECGLRRVEQLTRLQALRARPRRRRFPTDDGDRQIVTVPSNILDRQFAAEPPTSSGRLATIVFLASGGRPSLGGCVTAQFVADALLMASDGATSRMPVQLLTRAGERTVSPADA